MRKSSVIDDSFSRRLFLAQVMVCAGLTLLAIRLWYLQCLQGNYYRDLSENNRIRTIRTQAPRGLMYDREGKILVKNRPAFQVALMLEDTPDVPETIKKIAELLDKDQAELMTRFASDQATRRFEPKILLSDVSREELARLRAHTYSLPGVIVSVVPTRAYPFSDTAAQLVGYTREISRDQLGMRRDEGYYPGDIVGQSGLEKQYENSLRGEAGYLRVEVDARGARRGELGIVEFQQGADLHLTIDNDLQNAAEEALAGRRGAVVAVDPRNGELLAMVSSPLFDANIFSGALSAKTWEQINSDRDKPMKNRAIASIYPPGSTIKLLWALAGLAEGKIDTQKKFFCPGYFKLGRRRYHCHKREGHGMVNLQEAIMLSCNAYFYQLGQLLDIDLMHKYLELFGIGQKTGVALPGEETATLPSRQWKLERFGERWYPGDTLPVSIGQGYVTVTPVQLAMMVATIANGGTLYRPQLVKRVVNLTTGDEMTRTPEVVRKIDVDEKYFEIVRRAATSVVEAPRGTGKRSAVPGIPVAGKTGTAQVAALGKGGDNERLKHHAWFVGFAPAAAPEIALAVIVENAGGGGLNAAPVSQAILQTYFKKHGLFLPEGEEGPLLPGPLGEVQLLQAKKFSPNNDRGGASLEAQSQGNV